MSLLDSLLAPPFARCFFSEALGPVGAFGSISSYFCFLQKAVLDRGESERDNSDDTIANPLDIIVLLCLSCSLSLRCKDKCSGQTRKGKEPFPRFSCG